MLIETRIAIILFLFIDQQAKALARPFLADEITESASRKSAKAVTSPPNLTIVSGKRSTSPFYERTVGSPEYDHFGTDGKFASTGSLDGCPVDLSVDDVIHERGHLALRKPEIDKDDDISDKVDFNIASPPVDVLTTSQSSYQVDSTERLRLGSNPVFGSAPRLHVDANDDIMRQISGHPSSSARSTQSARPNPSYHRRSLSQDEQTWQYVQGQQNPSNANVRLGGSGISPACYQRAGEGRMENHQMGAYVPNANYVGANRAGGNSRLQNAPYSNEQQNYMLNRDNHIDNKQQQQHQQQQHQQQQQHVPNGNSLLYSRGAYSEEKLANGSSAQDLRNAYIKHQSALQSYKRGGHTHRRHQSNDELQNRNLVSSVARHPQQNGAVTSYAVGIPAGAQQRNLASPRSLDGFIDDEYESELQRSGYGTGFHRTNSLGRADMYKRYSGNKEYLYTDKPHQNRYKNTTDVDEERVHFEPRPVLSQSVQERLKEIPISISRGNTVNYDGYQNNRSNQVAYPGDPRVLNGVATRDHEDGVIHSRYDHGKSLAVPTQQASYLDEYFQSPPGDVSTGFDRSFSVRTSVTSRVSESDCSEMLQPNTVPDELKSFDATDLATKLFTLEGFTRDEVAPFLGKK